ncbi:ribokinase [Flavobacteriaceae bacterium TP-CH-4]|uniref:Ribokinase n=1 Tax=Pelagihabitans pacificus TaxID=2696054 RepID=A0A967B200_9FLAO|nr:ribokinase [Pelagihabitans pacificus]NHF60611.1 ribokinase [Pelagihabitans pacificus]
MPKITVVGSSNTDMVVKTTRFPEPGETIIGGDFYMFPGGKGANQAVAAARAGGEVSFICAVGDDLFGQNALKGYQEEGIDVSDVLVIKNGASGVALITVNAEGENEIVVASGTNAQLSAGHLKKTLDDRNDADIFLTQLETPMDSVGFLADYCKKSRRKLIINPAPAQGLSDVLLDGLFLITPNETEAKLLTGIEVTDERSQMAAADALLKKGVQHVIITLGSRGSFFKNTDESFTVSTPKVEAMDTTAAGDVYNGVLAVCLADAMGWRESMEYAGKAAALSVTKMGAQDTAPTREEINQFY